MASVVPCSYLTRERHSMNTPTHIQALILAYAGEDASETVRRDCGEQLARWAEETFSLARVSSWSVRRMGDWATNVHGKEYRSGALFECWDDTGQGIMAYTDSVRPDGETYGPGTTDKADFT